MASILTSSLCPSRTPTDGRPTAGTIRGFVDSDLEERTNLWQPGQHTAFPFPGILSPADRRVTAFGRRLPPRSQNALHPSRCQEVLASPYPGTGNPADGSLRSMTLKMQAPLWLPSLGRGARQPPSEKGCFYDGAGGIDGSGP